MLGSVKKLFLLIFIAIAANSAATVVSLFDAPAIAATGKKAKWNSPSKAHKVARKKKPRIIKEKTKSPRKKAKKSVTVKAKKKPAISVKKPIAKKINKPKNSATVPKVMPKSAPIEATQQKKVPTKELIVDQPITDEEIDTPQDRSTSPLLVVFIAFVLACVGGMFFLNTRRKQMEMARANFQEATTPNSAPETRIDAMNTSNLKPASTVDPAPSASKKLDMSAAPISAIKSTTTAVETRAPEPLNSSATLSPNIGAEPCSFERYVEIQVAAQCWRDQGQSLDPKLRELFNISTGDLLQYEFFWKQKISGNINLRKKYQELQPLFSSKYEAA